MIYSFIDIQTNRAFYLLKKNKNILLVGHKKPDSDTIGSMLALNLALEKLNKNVTCACADPIPPRFNFLPRVKKIFQLKNILDKIKGADLIVTLDCGDFKLTGFDHSFFRPGVFLINFDHHHDSSLFGKINIIKGSVSSTSEIIYDFLVRMGLLIDKDIATCLLCGIFGDTDSFKNPNTTNKTLIITSQLLALGANLKQVTKNTLQDKSLPTLRLWGKILSKIKRHKKLNIVSVVVTQNDLRKSKVSYEDLEGISNFLNSIPDVRASVIMTEKENGEIKGSFRTLQDDVDVSKLARILGGGGHKKAAGFVIPGRFKKNDDKWEIV
jgi:phosphoesterase RecJ-like protein